MTRMTRLCADPATLDRHRAARGIAPNAADLAAALLDNTILRRKLATAEAELRLHREATLARLGLSQAETRLFLALLANGRMGRDELALACGKNGKASTPTSVTTLAGNVRRKLREASAPWAVIGEQGGVYRVELSGAAQ